VTPELNLEEIADAILDGMPVDWSLVHASDAPGGMALVEQLKTLETLRLGRTIDRPKPSGTWQWGHLQVFEPIGRGAYGDVYRAWDSRLDREVALKLLPADVPSIAAPDSTVIEEGRLLARVRHPNVVTIYGAERIDGRVGLWMEFVKGRTFEEALRSGRTFTSDEVTRLGAELCRAVAAVHTAGLLHRDIKAQNVMLDDTGRLVLMDFGTGRELNAVTDVPIAGTPLYLAPEVLSGGIATPQSDVYSIGVLLFRLLTGSYPVSARDLAELRRAHAAGERTDARLDRPEIPASLRRIVTRAIDPNPDARYTGADELTAALASCDRAPVRRRVAMAIAAVVVIAAAFALGWNLGLRELTRPALLALGLTTTPTIAVMPFTNDSADPGNDGFVNGLTGEVIHNLSLLDGLHVRSMASSFLFKEQPRHLRDVDRSLDYVVEAGVQRAGNRLRINARLVRVADYEPVWVETYERQVDDVFAIQDEISLAIVNKLRLTLGRGQRRWKTNIPAYEQYLRGRAAVENRGTRQADEARKIFEQVIAMDPGYAPAYAGLADAYAEMSWQLSGLSPDEGLAGMRPAVEQALRLDPLLPEAHAAMGWIHARKLEWDEARDSFERAMELGPSLTHIQAGYAFATMLPQGQDRQAEALIAAAMLIDPPSLTLRRDLGFAQLIGGRYQNAVANLRQVVDAHDPTVFGAALSLARALTHIGRPAEAIAFFKSDPEHAAWERWMTFAYHRLGSREDVERLIAANKNDHPYRQALVYAGVGDKERTFAALDLAVAQAPSRTALLLAAPEMELLRGDPRLELLRKRLNLR
jgi:TolB-like protein/tetratricopeptide (TPR) repeat protein